MSETEANTDTGFGQSEIIDITKIVEACPEKWHNQTLSRVNDCLVRLGIFEGEFHWHKHDLEDELFYVVKGGITIRLRAQPDVVLGEGQLCVVPKGVEHCPESQGPSVVLLFEPRALKSRGD